MTQYQQPYTPVAQPTNGLAVAGLICSVAGLMLGGLLCPIGVLLSAIALGRPGGRGMAVAGLIVGLIGSCGGIIVVLLFGGLILLALGLTAAAVFIALDDPQRLEVTVEMGILAAAVEEYEDRNNQWPVSLDELSIEGEFLNDPWQQPYRLLAGDADRDYDIASDGPDQAPDTMDDIYLSRLGELWESFASFEGSGRSSFSFGSATIELRGDEEGGGVQIDLGGQKVELGNDEGGGKIKVIPSTTVPAENGDEAGREEAEGAGAEEPGDGK